jgi:hypothetical protein
MSHESGVISRGVQGSWYSATGSGGTTLQPGRCWGERQAVDRSSAFSQTPNHVFRAGRASVVLRLTQQQDNATKVRRLLLEKGCRAPHRI